MSRSVCTFIVLAAAMLHAPAALAQESGATLEVYYELARERNPMLRAAAAAVHAAAAAESSATLPPDPQLQIGIMNASLPGLRTDMPSSMAPSVQLMQMLPLPGNLRLAGEIARHTTAMADSDADGMWWDVRRSTAAAFFGVYEADRQIEVMRQTLEWLTQFEQVALSLYSTGSGTQSDVLRAGVEVARMKTELARMEAMRDVAAARLNAVVDQPGGTRVSAVAYTPLPAELPAPQELVQSAEAGSPLLARGRTALDRARAGEALARREIWPDVTVGVQYGRRGAEVGSEQMGSFMLGVGLPIFAGRRQLRMREEAAAMSAMSAAELQSLQAEVRADVAAQHAELSRTRSLITLYRTEVLPQAEANVASAFSSYRVGRVDFLTLVDARMTVDRYARELYALLAEYGWRIAGLEALLGRELPRSARTIQEES